MPNKPNHKFEALIANVPDIVLRLNRELHLIFVNKAIECVSGVDARNWAGKTAREYGLPVIFTDALDKRLPEVFKQGKEQDFEVQLPVLGEVGYFGVRLIPETDSNDKTDTVLVILRSQNQVRALLDERDRLWRESEQRFKILFEEFPLSIQIYAPDGLCLQANRAWEVLWQNDRAQLKGYNILEDKNAHSTGTIHEIRRAFAGEPVVLPPVLYNPEANDRQGRTRWIRAYFHPAKREDGTLREVILFLIDETEQRVAAEEVKQSRNQLDIILHGVTDGITVLDTSGKFVYANATGAKMCGFASVEEFLKTPTSAVMDRFELRDEDGSMYPIEKLPGRLALQGVKNPPEAVVRFRSKDTSEERWSIINATPVFDADGKVELAISIFRDFTERKNTENQLREAVRARNEFFSIASHELKTPLTSLLLQLQTLQRVFDKKVVSDQLLEDLSDKTRRSVNQARRLGGLVESLLDISRLEHGKIPISKELTDFISVVSETCERMEEDTKRRGSQITLNTGPGAKGFWDKVRFEQAVTNLLSNALKYGDGKPVVVEARVEGDKAVLSVRDQGPGIAEADQVRIFERFERAVSHLNISGMGLGLYITRQIADAHGGTLTLESKKGQGATFTLILPLRHGESSQ